MSAVGTPTNFSVLRRSDQVVARVDDPRRVPGVRASVVRPGGCLTMRGAEERNAG